MKTAISVPVAEAERTSVADSDAPFDEEAVAFDAVPPVGSPFAALFVLWLNESPVTETSAGTEVTGATGSLFSRISLASATSSRFLSPWWKSWAACLM